MKFKSLRGSWHNTKQILLSVLVVLSGLSSASALAQTIGTIGIGEITYATAKQNLAVRENILSSLSGELSKSLLETRKFIVLDYPQLERRITRQGLSLQSFYDQSYTSTELSQAGLDYILTADLVEFGLFNKQRSSSNSAIGLVGIDFKLLGVADATEGFSAGVSAQVRVPLEDGAVIDKDMVMNQAMMRAVDQLVDRVVSRLHPIRVMKISDDSVVTLNYGAGLLKAGDTIFVYPQSPDIEFDAKGKIVGDSVATLQVISTHKKFSSAQALEGFDHLEKGQKGQLLLDDG